VGLTGPIERPAPGTLPWRGDLAHVALADRFLVPHYVIPQIWKVGETGAALYLSASSESDVLLQFDPGAEFEALDFAGDWCWGCCGPEGPAGYVETKLLAE